MIYQIDKKIGRGAFGDVFLAYEIDTITNEKTGKMVAIKKYKKFTESDAREIEIMKELQDHCQDCVVCFIDFYDSAGPNKDEKWLISEYIKGKTMKEFRMIIRNRSLKIKVQVMLNIAKCLQKLHNLGIIHKDLKTDNIMINPDTLEVKLIDFGLSCRIEEIGTECKKYKGSMYYVDPNLISPHVMDKLQPYAYQLDIYSLGMIFYEILIGSLPRGIHTREIIIDKEGNKRARNKHPAKIKAEIIMEVRKKLNEVESNQELVKLIESMLSIDPFNRPSLDNITEDLNDILQ